MYIIRKINLVLTIVYNYRPRKAQERHQEKAFGFFVKDIYVLINYIKNKIFLTADLY